MSPRKSSTSSGRPVRRPRPRYLGLEAAGELLPFPSPRAWDAALRTALERADAATVRFKLIRFEGRRAVAEVDGADLARARSAWNSGPPALVSLRTWGTLVHAKEWLRAASDRRPVPGDGRGAED